MLTHTAILKAKPADRPYKLQREPITQQVPTCCDERLSGPRDRSRMAAFGYPIQGVPVPTVEIPARIPPWGTHSHPEVAVG